MTTLHAEIKFRNGVLLRALAERYPPGRQGYADLVQAAKDANMPYGTLCAWLRIHPKRRPYDSEGNPKPGVLSLCALLGKSAAELFPIDLYDANLPNTVQGEIPLDRLLPISAAKYLPSGEPTQEDLVLQRELQQAVNEVLKTLRPREAEVIRKRFGLDGWDEQTLEEVGQQIENKFGEGGVSRNRVKQIEAHALTTLRHPSRSRKLRQFLETYSGTVSIPEPPVIPEPPSPEELEELERERKKELRLIWKKRDQQYQEWKSRHGSDLQKFERKADR